MARNKLVYGLSEVTFVVTCDEEKGGTWAGAVESLERGYGRVVVWMGPHAGPGNAALVAKGATPIYDLEDETWLFPDSEPASRRFVAQRLF
jgi:predicted Rossmann fold nucleotide-binding protein DprA/Smf involved in DNA uptake